MKSFSAFQKDFDVALDIFLNFIVIYFGHDILLMEYLPKKSAKIKDKNSISLEQEVQKLNYIYTYSLPSQSQFKCHFTLKKIYMPRKQTIDEFFLKLQKILSVAGSISILQLSNVYENQLVDVSVGMTYDRDAYKIINNNIPFKLQSRNGLQESYQPVASNAFKIFTLKQPYFLEIEKSSSITKQESKNQSPIQNKNEPSNVYQGKFTSVKIIGVPKQYSAEILLQAFLKYPFGEIPSQQVSIKQKQESNITYFQVSMRPDHAQMLLEKGLDIRGLPLIVMQKKQQLNIKSQLAEHQIHVNSVNQKIDHKRAYDTFLKYGPIVNLYDLNSQKGGHLVITFSNKKSAQTATQDTVEGLKATQAHKSHMLKLRRISLKSSFYTSLICKQ